MRLLRHPAMWLPVLALLALPVVGTVKGWWLADRFPLRTLRVQGQLQRVDRAQLQSTVLAHARAGFFAVDLGAVQDAVADLPWVEQAEVRKHWPDILELRLHEYRPLARWGKDRLLSEHGHLFPVGRLQVPPGLPLLDGPATRVDEVTALYEQARAQFAPAGGITGVAIDARGSWTVTLADGTRIVLGRNDPAARVARFAPMLPRLREANPGRRLARVDLRYTNGFALVWTAPPAAPATPAASGGRPPAPRAGVAGGPGAARLAAVPPPISGTTT